MMSELAAIPLTAVLWFWSDSTQRRRVYGCEQGSIISIITLMLQMFMRQPDREGFTISGDVSSVGHMRGSPHFSLLETG